MNFSELKSVQPKDKDLNTELFGDNDDRRNKVVNRNNQPRRNIVVQQPQQQDQYQDTKYIKYEYQQEKEIVYDIQGKLYIRSNSTQKRPHLT